MDLNTFEQCWHLYPLNSWTELPVAESLPSEELDPAGIAGEGDDENKKDEF